MLVLQEEDPNRNKKKPLGDTNHYCPVALKETSVLFPGNPEVAAKYREKVYYFSSNDARDKFLANPEEFLPRNGPPKVCEFSSQDTFTKTHFSWEHPKRVIDKQCRPWSDAADLGIWSGSALFALVTGISVKT